MSFKDNSVVSSGGHFVQWSLTICAILVDSIMKSIKYMENDSAIHHLI